MLDVARDQRHHAGVPWTPETEDQLTELYGSIDEFAVERDRGATPLLPRAVVPRALDAKVLLLAQGLAQGTQRITGFPYRRPGGLSDAGRRLDAFLEPVGHTIDHTDRSRLYAYSTDLVPWYPGKAGRFDAEPTAAEVAQCWSFVEREVALVEPHAIVLLGRPAARWFLQLYAGEKIGRSKPSLLALAGRAWRVQIAAHETHAVVAWHPSAAWGKFAAPAETTYREAQRVIQSLQR